MSYVDDVLAHPGLAGMRAKNRWIVCRLTPKEGQPGKWSKDPIHHTTGHRTGSNDPNGWTDVHTAAAAARRMGPNYCLGYCFDGQDGEFFIDLDGALVDGQWSPLAQQVLQVFAGAAVEVSSSGTGLHVFGRTTSMPRHSSRNSQYHAELYSHDRFAAMTAQSMVGDCATDHTAALNWFAATYFPPGSASEHDADVPNEVDPRWRGPVDDAVLIRRALNGNGPSVAFGIKASFAQLYDADEAALAKFFPHDHKPFNNSDADMALFQRLAWWCGRWPERMERIARTSKLYREKWDSGDYLQRTIATAVRRQEDVLCDPEPQPGPATSPPPAPPAAGASPAPAAPVPVTGSTFLSPEQQIALFAGCVYIRDMHRIMVPGGSLLTPDKFRAEYGGYTFSMDLRNERTTRNAWEAFTESQALRMPRAEQTCFKPALPYGAILQQGGVTLANSYSAPRVDRTPGDVTPFLRHLSLLVPDEYERKCVFYTLCCLVQRQGYKAQYALVLQGTEGNGKSFLAKCVAKAIGEKHVHYPRADKIAAGFNGWLRGHTLYVVEEIMVGDRQDIVDILKTMITADSGIEIEQKGVDQVTAEICGNFICTTNHRHALRKTANDRRWFVVYTAQQSRADLERDGMLGTYMNDLHAWGRAGGHAAVADLLWTTPIPAEFDFSRGLQRAPVTASTADVIAASQGAVEQEIIDAVERGELGFRGDWVSSHYMDALLKRIGRDKAIPINRRRELLHALGYVPHPTLPQGRTNNMVLPDGVKSRLFVLSTRADLCALSAPEAAKKYAQDQGAA